VTASRVDQGRPERISSLDGVRGVAVFIVIVAHTLPQDRIPVRWIHLGRLGVDAFFALSGYLITENLLRSKNELLAGRLTWVRAMGTFYMRRALRIVPAYALTLAVCLFVGYAPVRDHIAWLLSYTVNFGQVFFHVPFGFADHCWSLALEEQFYLVWPTTVLALAPRSRRFALWALLVGVSLANAAVAFSGASSLFCFRLPFLGSMIPLFLGAVLAEEVWSVEKRGRAPGKALEPILWTIGLALCALTQGLWFSQGAREKPVYIALVDVAFSAVSVALLSHLLSRAGTPSPISRTFGWGPVRWLGVLSYGIYLAHRLLMPPVEKLLLFLGLGGSVSTFLLVLTAASVAAAALSWYGVEQPLQRWKRLFPYAPRA
jgi:peptidoglycan/LPS O-acetylase OafA/YrhL